jgi:nicotinamide mononucleotide transporter
MFELLSINNVIFTIAGYPMSLIEFVGTIFYLWSVWLISRKNILTWPIGIISVLLYMVLFYQIQLYSDTIEQVYYLGASVYGWWIWDRSSKENRYQLQIEFSKPKWISFWIFTTLIGTILTFSLMKDIHLLLPTIFQSPASYPFLDALTTIMSFTAMWLMARKKIESWIYWIIVDCIGIWLYYEKEVRFLSILYIILLIMAINGLLVWWKERAVTS